MKYEIRLKNSFKRAFKRCLKRGLDQDLFWTVVNILAETGTLPTKYKPHKLSGKYEDFWECHIQPDWLLIWEQHDTELILILIDTGTHADLFE
jgi:mRNA interferase YafQ